MAKEDKSALALAILGLGKAGGGSGEPAEYIKSAEVSEDGNTLTLTDKNDTQVVFAPESEEPYIAGEGIVIDPAFKVINAVRQLPIEGIDDPSGAKTIHLGTIALNTYNQFAKAGVGPVRAMGVGIVDENFIYDWAGSSGYYFVKIALAETDTPNEYEVTQYEDGNTWGTSARDFIENNLVQGDSKYVIMCQSTYSQYADNSNDFRADIYVGQILTLPDLTLIDDGAYHYYEEGVNGVSIDITRLDKYLTSLTKYDDGVVYKVPQPDGTTITLNSDGELQATGGSGQSYTPGQGIDITNDVISATTGVPEVTSDSNGKFLRATYSSSEPYYTDVQEVSRDGFLAWAIGLDLILPALFDLEQMSPEFDGQTHEVTLTFMRDESIPGITRINMTLPNGTEISDAQAYFRDRGYNVNIAVSSVPGVAHLIMSYFGHSGGTQVFYEWSDLDKLGDATVSVEEIEPGQIGTVLRQTAATTFADNIKLSIIPDDACVKVQNESDNAGIEIKVDNDFKQGGGAVFPYGSTQMDLGNNYSSNYMWRNLYLSGGLCDYSGNIASVYQIINTAGAYSHGELAQTSNLGTITGVDDPSSGHEVFYGSIPLNTYNQFAKAGVGVNRGEGVHIIDKNFEYDWAASSGYYFVKIALAETETPDEYEVVHYERGNWGSKCTDFIDQYLKTDIAKYAIICQNTYAYYSLIEGGTKAGNLFTGDIYEGKIITIDASIIEGLDDGQYHDYGYSTAIYGTEYDKFLTSINSYNQLNTYKVPQPDGETIVINAESELQVAAEEETWTFTLDDDTTVTKTILVK